MNASPIIPRMDHTDEDPPTPFMCSANLLSYMSPQKQQTYMRSVAQPHSSQPPQPQPTQPPQLSLTDPITNNQQPTINALIQTLENQNARLMTMFESVCMRNMDYNRDLESRVRHLEVQNAQLIHRLNCLERQTNTLPLLPLSPRN